MTLVTHKSIHEQQSVLGLNCSQVAQQGNTGGRWIIVLVYVVGGDSHGPTEQRGLTIIFLQEQGPLFIYEDLFIVVCYISVLGNTSESTRERQKNAHPKHNHLISFQLILFICAFQLFVQGWKVIN